MQKKNTYTGISTHIDLFISIYVSLSLSVAVSAFVSIILPLLLPLSRSKKEGPSVQRSLSYLRQGLSLSHTHSKPLLSSLTHILWHTHTNTPHMSACADAASCTDHWRSQHTQWGEQRPNPPLLHTYTALMIHWQWRLGLWWFVTCLLKTQLLATRSKWLNSTCTHYTRELLKWFQQCVRWFTQTSWEWTRRMVLESTTLNQQSSSESLHVTACGVSIAKPAQIIADICVQEALGCNAPSRIELDCSQGIRVTNPERKWLYGKHISNMFFIHCLADPKGPSTRSSSVRVHTSQVGVRYMSQGGTIWKRGHIDVASQVVIVDDEVLKVATRIPSHDDIVPDPCHPHFHDYAPTSIACTREGC